MRIFTYALATAAGLIFTPAMAAPATDAPIVLAQVGLDVHVGGGDRERSGVVVRDGDRGARSGIVIRDGRRSYNRDRIVVRRAPACRMITVRTRTPGGRVIIKQTRSCR